MSILSGQSGDPIAVAFSAGNFTGNASMTWTVAAAANVPLFEYVSTGGFCRVRASLVTTTVGGTPSTDLQITIPNSLVAAEAVLVPIYICDNNVLGVGYAAVAAAGTVIACRKITGGAWTASTSQTGLFVDITFRVR